MVEYLSRGGVASVLPFCIRTLLVANGQPCSSLAWWQTYGAKVIATVATEKHGHTAKQIGADALMITGG